MTVKHNKYTIHKADEWLKRQIELFFITEFPENILLSHGIEHHRRVWNYAVELINAGYVNTNNLNELFIDNLLMACYFHDIGMAENQDKNHGLTSRKKCLEFIAKFNLNADNFAEALNAIEFHDDKTYSAAKTTNNVLAVLSVADDLDAFGFIGIYRYADIYLRRGLKKTELGKKVMDNAKRRFDNFINDKNTNSALLKKHISRYNILNIFFEAYNNSIEHYISINAIPNGYCGVIDIIYSLINSADENDLSNVFSAYSNDSIISWFTEGISEELKRLSFSSDSSIINIKS